MAKMFYDGQPRRKQDRRVGETLTLRVDVNFVTSSDIACHTGDEK